MLQKYFPIVGEVNSPLAMMAALGFTSNAAEIAVKGVSNRTLETLLWNAVEETAVYKKEVEVSASELETARRAAVKELRTLRYRAACAARKARKVAKDSRQVKAVRKPIAKGSLKSLKGLDINICRTKAAQAQAAVRFAANSFNTAHEVVCATLQGGDIRSIRSAVAALKVTVRELEVAHLEFHFAREMLSISLARHSA